MRLLAVFAWAAAGDVWDIATHAFLGLYIVGFAVISVGIVLDRRAAGNPAQAADPGALDQYEVAMLNGGEELAVIVALVNLWRIGAIDVGDGAVRQLAEAGKLDLKRLAAGTTPSLGIRFQLAAVAPVTTAAHPVEHAVYQVAAEVPNPDAATLGAECASHPALVALKDRPIAGGLVRDERQARRMRRQWLWFLPLLLSGMAVFGAAGGFDAMGRSPLGLLLLALIVTVWAMLWAAQPLAGRTGPADLALWAVRTRRPDLEAAFIASGQAPVDVVPSDLGMLLALYGAAALWERDPALAESRAPTSFKKLVVGVANLQVEPR